MDKKRIAFVSTSVNEIGGQTNHLKSLYKYLDKGRFETYIFFCSKIESRLKKYLIDAGMENEGIVIVPWIKKCMVIPLILEIRKQLLQKRIDIVHTTDIQSDLFGALAARLSGIRNIFSLHSAKIIPDNISFIKIWIYKILNYLLKNWFTETVVVSNGLKKELIGGRFRPPDKARVIHLGIEVPRTYRDIRFPFSSLKNKRPVIGTLAGFQKVKGIDRLICIMPLILKDMPEASFLIIGQGIEENSLKAMIDRIGLREKVRFGKVPWRESVFPGMEKIDIFVMPSVREGCPNALLEALAAARPVIASDIEGIKDIIENGKDGILVDTANPVLFSEKILDLCRDPDRAICLGENGRQKVLTDFTIGVEIEQYMNLYSGCLRGPKRRVQDNADMHG